MVKKVLIDGGGGLPKLSERWVRKYEISEWADEGLEMMECVRQSLSRGEEDGLVRWIGSELENGVAGVYGTLDAV